MIFLHLPLEGEVGARSAAGGVSFFAGHRCGGLRRFAPNPRAGTLEAFLRKFHLEVLLKALAHFWGYLFVLLFCLPGIEVAKDAMQGAGLVI